MTLKFKNKNVKRISSFTILQDIPEAYRLVVSLFAKSAAAYNPIIYFFMFKGFRKDTAIVFQRSGLIQYWFILDTKLTPAMYVSDFFKVLGMVQTYSTDHSISDIADEIDNMSLIYGHIDTYLFSIKISYDIWSPDALKSFPHPCWWLPVVSQCSPARCLACGTVRVYSALYCAVQVCNLWGWAPPVCTCLGLLNLLVSINLSLGHTSLTLLSC